MWNSYLRKQWVRYTSECIYIHFFKNWNEKLTNFRILLWVGTQVLKIPKTKIIRYVIVQN